MLLTSCDMGNGTQYIQKNKVLVLNQGNYTAQDASVYIYDEDEKTMTPNAFARANNNTKIGATLMSGTFSNYGIGYLLCSNPDKIEVVNVVTLQTLCNPITTGLSNTREIVLDAQYIYVTNAGEDFVEDSYGIREYTNSYVSVYDPSDNSLIKKIELGSDAQGMLCRDGFVYVGTKEGIVKITPSGGKTFNQTEPYADEEYTGAVKYLCYYNELIYASIPGYGIIAYDPMKERTVARYPVADYLDSVGYILMDNAGNIYTYATDWSTNTSAVYKISTTTGNVSTVLSGESIYSLGISHYSGNMFTSESNGFSTNSTMNVTNLQNNSLVDTQFAGIGTFRYLFFTYYDEDTSEKEK